MTLRHYIGIALSLSLWCNAGLAVSLKAVPIPPVPGLNNYVQDEAKAILLGKALFWDMQSGSDGQACASCHFHAGADNRIKNTLNPGQAGGDNTFNNTASGASGGPNYTLDATDFPFHQLQNPFDRESPVTHDSNDVVGSSGVHSRQFIDIIPGAAEEDCSTLADSIFHVSGSNVRQVTGRNTPTTINAIFNFRNFWDGRANNVFNGVDPFGPRNITAGIWVRQLDNSIIQEPVRLINSSLASQAVGPPGSQVEMICNGRKFAHLGRKLLDTQIVPLALQEVDSTDSVLGPHVAPSGKGLTVNYLQMVHDAFHPKLWDATGDFGGFTQIEANFSLFWGLAIQLYEATLVSDDTPFDQFLEGKGGLTDNQIHGMQVFNGPGRLEGVPATDILPGHGLCGACHNAPEFTGAANRVLSIREENIGAEGIMEFMNVGDIFVPGAASTAQYDNGFYNIGVRPTAEDIGTGGTDPFGFPLSFTRLSKNHGLVSFENNIKKVTIPEFTITDPVSGAIIYELDLCTLTIFCEVPPNARDAVDGSFKVPSLRNIELTGPYFHNGGTATLEQVIDFYRRGGDRRDLLTGGDTTGFGVNLSNLDENITNLLLSEQDESDLVAFMKGLTDERVRWEMAPFDHPQLLVRNGHPGDTMAVNDDGTGNATDSWVERPVVGAAGRVAKGLPPLKNFLDAPMVDADADGRIDSEDNCINDMNGPIITDAGNNSQRDTDGDGFGNVCDTDLNNDSVTNLLDVGVLKSVFLCDTTFNPEFDNCDHADFNGDGVVNLLDVGFIKKFFLKQPG
jgi:cytochrome c peroxidase